MIRFTGESPGRTPVTPATARRRPVPRDRRGSPRSPVSVTFTEPPRAEHWNPATSVFLSFSPQYGPRQQWAEPVTGSSGTPADGAKNREIKSTSGRSEAEVTMIPRAGRAARAAMSGSQSQTSAAVGSSTSRSNRFFPTKRGAAPSARSSPGMGGTACAGSAGKSRLIHAPSCRAVSVPESVSKEIGDPVPARPVFQSTNAAASVAWPQTPPPVPG